MSDSATRRLAHVSSHLSSSVPLPLPYRAELSPLLFLRRTAHLFGHRPAVAAFAHHPVRSWHAFTLRCLDFAHALCLHVGTGARVAFVCANTPAMLEGHFAVPAAGGVIVPINYRLLADDVLYIVRHSGANVVVVDEAFRHLLQPAASDGIRVIVVRDQGEAGGTGATVGSGTAHSMDGDEEYEGWMQAGREQRMRAGGDADPWRGLCTLADEESTLSICYTSGTTGRPKGVMLTHRGVYLAALANVIHARLDERSVYLWTLPLFHCNGWTFPYAVAAVGATNVMLRSIDYDRIWQCLIDNAVTHFNAAPTVNIQIVNHARALRLPQPVIVCVAGSAPSPSLLAGMRALNMTPLHMYGLTETYGPAAVCQWQPEWDALGEADQARMLARQGQCYITGELVRVVHPLADGDDVLVDIPADGTTVGEIVFRGNMTMRGYLDDADATLRAFAGGWFHSGDLAVMHPDGYIDVRDRQKDIIISGGENISTIEVENCIAACPVVLECAVIAVPDECWGERPKAFVVPRENGMSMGSEELKKCIQQWCKERLAGFKQPGAIQVVTSLPKTATGKIQKFVLRNEEWASRGSRRVN